MNIRDLECILGQSGNRFMEEGVVTQNVLYCSNDSEELESLDATMHTLTHAMGVEFSQLHEDLGFSRPKDVPEWDAMQRHLRAILNVRTAQRKSLMKLIATPHYQRSVKQKILAHWVMPYALMNRLLRIRRQAGEPNRPIDEEEMLRFFTQEFCDTDDAIWNQAEYLSLRFHKDTSFCVPTYHIVRETRGKFHSILRNIFSTLETCSEET